MPLSVEIKINGSVIETVWIGRLEALRGQNETHEYITGVGTESLEAWNMPGVVVNDIPRFTHNYADGARECVRLALAALQDRELRT